ncbi:MAG: hypothetical protein IT381_07595 [Deltaproteobacteria bacterium]|nr:hypothetical protein [Deltaproteobacteria bacterium]
MSEPKSFEGLDPAAGHDHEFHRESMEKDKEWLRQEQEKRAKEDPAFAEYLRTGKWPEEKATPSM